MLINDVNAKIEDGEEPIMFNWEKILFCPPSMHRHVERSDAERDISS